LIELIESNNLDLDLFYSSFSLDTIRPSYEPKISLKFLVKKRNRVPVNITQLAETIRYYIGVRVQTTDTPLIHLKK